MSRLDAARAEIVNRTHRVVRERAMAMNSRHERQRSLWVPLAICSALLITLSYSAWTLLSPVDPSQEQPALSSEPGSLMPLLLMWFLPMTVALGIFILVRTNRDHGSN